MKLYFNGCSFVYGGELDNPERDSFPNVLQRKIGCEILDDSENGISNQRILRTTLSRDLSDCFVIIGWTSLFRYEYFEDGWETVYTQNQVPYLKVEWFIMNFINQVLAVQNYLKYNNIPFFFFLSMSKNYQGRWKGIAEANREHIKEWFDKFWKDINNKPVEKWLDGYDNWFKFIDEGDDRKYWYHC